MDAQLGMTGRGGGSGRQTERETGEGRKGMNYQQTYA